MKIGFVVSFFDFRNDVRRLIAAASRSHEVVVFVKQKDVNLIHKHLPDSVEYQVIYEKKRSISNTIWERIYFLLRSIPKSRSNFFLMEFFKLSLATSTIQRKKNHLWYKLLVGLPKFISYDFYLSRLQIIRKTKIDDIDQFIFFTAIADDYLLARLLKENYPVKVYVYSWDHPCKHTCFSQKVDYLVGNERLRNNLSELQNLPLNKIHIAGISQFGYLHEYLQNQLATTSPYPQPYFYFGCAIGIPELAIEEVVLIQMMATTLAEERPELLLVVRPYPFLLNLQIYEELKNLSNVVIDDQYRSSDLAVSDNNIVDKLNKLKHAIAFFHLGTTLGLEACLLGTPSFLIAPEPTSSRRLSLHNFAHQHQNKEYLISLSPSNTLTSMDKIKEILVSENLQDYKKLNREISQLFPTASFEQVAHLLLNLPKPNSEPHEK